VNRSVWFMERSDLEALRKVRDRVATGEAARVRKAARVTQTEVARTIGVSHAAVANWETGRRLPRGEAALRYGSLLDFLESRLTVGAP